MYSSSSCCESTTTPQLGSGRAHRVGQVDSLGGVRRRHPDVGEQDVGRDPPGELHRFARVGRAADDLDVRLLVEKSPEALAGHEVVLRDQDPHPAGHPHMMADLHAPRLPERWTGTEVEPGRGARVSPVVGPAPAHRRASKRDAQLDRASRRRAWPRGRSQLALAASLRRSRSTCSRLPRCRTWRPRSRAPTWCAGSGRPCGGRAGSAGCTCRRTAHSAPR